MKLEKQPAALSFYSIHSAFLAGVLLLSLVSTTALAQSLDHNSTADASVALAVDSVVNLPSSHGAYDLRLIEPLSELGELQQELGDYRAAAATFRQVFQISRINHGLYHEGQIPVLESLIVSEKAQRNWEAVDEYYSYLQHLLGRLYEFEDPRFDIGLATVVSWHVSAFNVNIDGKRIEHLQKAHQIFRIRLQIAQLTLGADDPKIEFLTRNIAISERRLYRPYELGTGTQRSGREGDSRYRTALADRD